MKLSRTEKPAVDAQHLHDTGETLYRRPPSPGCPGVNYVKTFGGETELPGLAVDVALRLYENKAEKSPADEAVILALRDAQDARDGVASKKGEKQEPKQEETPPSVPSQQHGPKGGDKSAKE
jgi:hypothetical protein